jgi:hypothetical protein
MALGDTMAALKLMRRKDLLDELGFDALASRSSWSHDVNGTIVFDAWEHHWTRDAQRVLKTYPLRTNGKHYNLAQSRQNRRRGHTRWQNHVDLVVSGKRTPRAIVPVANDPNANPNRGAKGWLPIVVEGHIEVDGSGQVQFLADNIVSLVIRG